LRRRWAPVLGRALCEQQPCAETFLSLSKQASNETRCFVKTGFG
jgi:hypothetical protein